MLHWRKSNQISNGPEYMSERTTNILGYLTLFAILGAIWVMFGEDPTREQGARGERTFAGLEDRINEVRTVTLVQGSDAVALIQEKDGWVIKERQNYKATTEKVLSLLRGVALSDRREPKTSNKDRYSRLNLGDKAISIKLLDETGGQLIAFDMGKRTSNASGRSLTYISQDRDTRAWLVTNLAEASASPTWWLDTDLLSIQEKRVSDVKVGSVWLTRKIDETNFDMQGLRAGEEAAAYWQLREPSRIMSSLSFEDVRKLNNPLTDPVGLASFTTHDGLSVGIEMFKMDGGHWARITASFDPDIQTQGAGGVLEGAPADGAAEADKVGDQVEGWLFKLGSADADVLTRKRADFLKAKTE